jgi:hypothetical protein
MAPGMHPALLCRAYGSYAYRSAEADGNRTRLSRVAAHTGFEDRGAHQDPDTSSRHSSQRGSGSVGPDSYSDSNSSEQSRPWPQVHKGLRPDGEAASAVRPGGLPRRLVLASREITGTGLTEPR